MHLPNQTIAEMKTIADQAKKADKRYIAGKKTKKFGEKIISPCCFFRRIKTSEKDDKQPVPFVDCYTFSIPNIIILKRIIKKIFGK